MENEVRKLRATLAERKAGRWRPAPDLDGRARAAPAGQSWFRIGREIGLAGRRVRLCKPRRKGRVPEICPRQDGLQRGHPFKQRSL
jgi:hypothetical protein